MVSEVFTYPVQLVSVPDVGVPRIGVTNVGEVANTAAPVPVSSVRADARLALDGVARNVAIPDPRPETPVDIGSPVALVNVPDEGVPSTPPLTTGAPAVPTLTASAVATPVPNPEMPVETGKPVALVSVPDVGVPSTGVVIVGEVSVGVASVGDVARTTDPVPVFAVAARPLMLRELPVPAVSNVVFVKVLVAAAI